jgi:hypothetical protein
MLMISNAGMCGILIQSGSVHRMGMRLHRRYLPQGMRRLAAAAAPLA